MQGDQHRDPVVFRANPSLMLFKLLAMLLDCNPEDAHVLQGKPEPQASGALRYVCCIVVNNLTGICGVDSSQPRWRRGGLRWGRNHSVKTG